MATGDDFRAFVAQNNGVDPATLANVSLDTLKANNPKGWAAFSSSAPAPAPAPAASAPVPSTPQDQLAALNAKLQAGTATDSDKAALTKLLAAAPETKLGQIAPPTGAQALKAIQDAEANGAVGYLKLPPVSGPSISNDTGPDPYATLTSTGPGVDLEPAGANAYNGTGMVVKPTTATTATTATVAPAATSGSGSTAGSNPVTDTTTLGHSNLTWADVPVSKSQPAAIGGVPKGSNFWGKVLGALPGIAHKLGEGLQTTGNVITGHYGPTTAEISKEQGFQANESAKNRELQANILQQQGQIQQRLAEVDAKLKAGLIDADEAAKEKQIWAQSAANIHELLQTAAPRMQIEAAGRIGAGGASASTIYGQ
jgi:hypothetical protein